MEISGNVPPEWQEILEQAKQVEEEERRNRLPSEAPRVPSPGGNGAHSSPTDDFRRAQYYTAKVPGAGQGNRNSCLNHLAFHLLELFPSLTEIQHRELCMNWAASCNPPYDREGTEAEKTIGSGWKSAHAKGAVGAKYNPPIERRLVPEVHERETEIFFPEETAPGGNGSHAKEEKAAPRSPLGPVEDGGGGISRPAEMQEIVFTIKDLLKSEGGLAEAEEYAKTKMPRAVTGHRPNHEMLMSACTLLGGFRLSKDAALPILLEYNKECVPPWPEDAVKEKIKEAGVALLDEECLLKLVTLNEKRDKKNLIPKQKKIDDIKTSDKDDFAAPPERALPQLEQEGEVVAVENFTKAFTIDDNGKVVIKTIYVPIRNVSQKLLAATGDWPRCVAKVLFVEDNEKIRFLEAPEELFAWIHEQAQVNWKDGLDSKMSSTVTKAEFHSHLHHHTKTYEEVSLFPHHPPNPNYYYLWRRPTYDATGKYFSKLLSFFRNVEDETDFAIIKAMFMAPAWGCEPGSRPAFTIMAPDRRCGKSTLADSVALLYGGSIELNLTKRDEDYFVTRLLSPDALSKRIVRIDNQKFTCDSSVLESLITNLSISGHRLHHGEAVRPNTLTYILTGNNLTLSRDMADRSFIIRLIRPDMVPTWRHAVFSFIRKFRNLIICDIINELQKDPVKADYSGERWSDFAMNVLSKCDTDPLAVLRVNWARRDGCDAEVEEANDILDAIHGYLERTNPLMNEVFLSTSQILEVVTGQLHVKWSAKALNHKMAEHMAAGRMKDIRKSRTNSANGFTIKRKSTVSNRVPDFLGDN